MGCEDVLLRVVKHEQSTTCPAKAASQSTCLWGRACHFQQWGIATVHNTLTTVYMDPVEKCRKPDLAPPKPMPSAATKMSAIP